MITILLHPLHLKKKKKVTTNNIPYLKFTLSLQNLKVISEISSWVFRVAGTTFKFVSHPFIPSKVQGRPYAPASFMS